MQEEQEQERDLGLGFFLFGMGRKHNETESNRWKTSWLVLIALVSCSLVYMWLSVGFRRRISSNFAVDLSSVSEESAANGDGGLECYRGIENLELWGPVVKRGTDYSSEQCCQACKSMCSGDGPCLCNSWVFCGDREKCGDKFGERK